MDAREHLDALECDLGQVTVQLMVINATLQYMTNIPNSTPTMTTEITDTMMANGVHGPISKLKPAPPSDFDGDRKKGHAFLNSCELYIYMYHSLMIISLMNYPKFIGHSHI